MLKNGIRNHYFFGRNDGSGYCGGGIRGVVWDLGGVAPEISPQVTAGFLFVAAAKSGRRPRINQPERRAHAVGQFSRCGPVSIQPMGRRWNGD